LLPWLGGKLESQAAKHPHLITTKEINVREGQRLLRLAANGDVTPLAAGGASDDDRGGIGGGAAQAAQGDQPGAGNPLGGSEAGLATDGVRRPRLAGEQGHGHGGIDGLNGSVETETDTRARRASKRNKRAYMTLATLNMNGKSMMVDGIQRSKWTEVHNMMKVKRLGILALQETHLCADDMRTINDLYTRRLEVVASKDPDRETQSAGVAFVLNKDVIETDDIEVTEIIPGRALLLSINWRKGQRTSILNVYAPNTKREQVTFYDALQAAWSNGRRKPDFMVGDFNLVEDAIDRAPARMDDLRATTAMREAREAMGLIDGWRHTFINARRFTYQSQRGAMSRLDRIYCRRERRACLFEWTTEESPVPSDHRMVSVRFAPEDSPEMGKGRWTWPRMLYNNPILKRALHKRLQRLAKELAGWADDGGVDRERNPQIMLRDMKEDLQMEAKKVANIDMNRVRKKIQSLQLQIGVTENKPEIDDSFDIQQEIAQMRQEHEHLMRTVRKEQRDAAGATWEKSGEVIAPYWVSQNKEHRPRDLFTRLCVPGSRPPQYVNSSSAMAEAMKTHYDGVQRPRQDADQSDAQRTELTREVLGSIPDESKLNGEESEKLASLLTADDVRRALKSMPGERATGVDGIPYEVWKTLLEMGKITVPERRGGAEMDAADMLARVFNDIQRHGVDARTDFHKGWICPLYKKGEHTEPGNYRPITLLNSDYKVMTKALTMRLTTVVAKMIHPDQAGFVPGRLIFDHVRLSKAMISYAEAYEENGVIVALDQEKAYDRVRHDYLWKTLSTFGVPQPFIDSIKYLYAGARSVVILNGEMSGTFEITRGVRQGDPLSCLLFDLAIEPLGCMLRGDARLSGYRIPGRRDKLIVNLFADDTLIYLNARDKMTDLLEVLDKWCGAAGARFNEDKTEVVPIGSAAFRTSVAAVRHMGNADETIPTGMRIARDGHTIRSLGARIGNGGDELAPWSVILDKIGADLRRWQKAHPSLDGKRSIVQMVVGGKTQYLAKVQGMPKDVEDRIERMIRSFMWPNKRTPPISMVQLCKTREEGGIGLLDIRARNLAIEGTWVRDYLNLTATRPTWAWVTDELLRRSVPDVLEHMARGNAFLHNWKIPTRGERVKRLPADVKSMLKAMAKLDVHFAAVKMSEELKLQMPAWGHMGAARWTYNQGRDECLAERHAIDTVGDLLDASRRPTRDIAGRRHANRSNCACAECKVDREAGCMNPAKCVARAGQILSGVEGKFDPSKRPPSDGLTLTHRRLEKNAFAIREKAGERTFDPSVTIKTSLAEGFRIFVDAAKMSAQPAHRLMKPLGGLSMSDRKRVIYTDGSCTGNGETDARCGAGVWHAEGSNRNRAVRVPGGAQSNQVGEIVAVIVALRETPAEVPVVIRTDSLYVMDGMTKHLATWEDRGWIGVTNREHLKALAYRLRKRTAPVYFEKVKAHSGEPGNEGADELAKEGAEKDSADVVDLRVEAAYDLQGAKLSGITQSTLYKGIRERSAPVERRRTQRNVATAQSALRDAGMVAKPEAALWQGMRNKDIRKNIGQFLFQAMHGTQKVGASHWANIPGYETRAICEACGHGDESMQHILLECRNPHGQRLVWKLVEALWPRDGPRMPRLTMGLLLACGSLRLKQENDTERGDASTRRDVAGAGRLMRIVLSESAHLIWALRCERAIQGKAHTVPEVRGRWMNKMNVRLALDRASAIKVQRTKWSRRALRDTWHRVVEVEEAAEPGSVRGPWTSDLRVLVGIRPPTSRSYPEGRT
jgi:ribonuclease HI/exonuclease III